MGGKRKSNGDIFFENLTHVKKIKVKETLKCDLCNFQTFYQANLKRHQKKSCQKSEESQLNAKVRTISITIEIKIYTPLVKKCHEICFG